MGIFGLEFHLYGFLIGAGVLAAAAISAGQAARAGLRRDLIWDSLWWVLIPAIIGARLYHVIDRWNDVYRLDPLAAAAVWNGGLGIFGGLIGGAAGLWGYWKLKLSKTVPFLDFLDLAFSGVLAGQAIGRIGNFFNQEVYGLPTTLLWAITIDPARRLAGYEQFSTFHPLFAYEILWNLAGFFLWWMVGRRNRRLIPSTAAFYLIWYGTGRFFLDILRPIGISLHAPLWGATVDIARVLSAAMVALGAWIWKRTRRTVYNTRV